MRASWRSGTASAALLVLTATVATAPERAAAAEPAWRPRPAPDGDLMYFVLVDRFANGDPANDGDVDGGDPQAWHGGDIAGVIDHLDDLRRLGVTTVWLSPVFDCRTEPFLGWGAFHGYWVEDLTSVEPRFGTEADLRRLSDELHARDMRLILDLVLNHVAMDGALLAEHPAWFHDECDVEDWDDPRQLTTCRVHGLPDLDQDNPETYAYLLDASLGWIDRVHPDGFRIDAVRHMDTAFLARFAADVRAHAGEGFELLGEDFQGDAAALARAMRDGGFTAMFDFPLHYAMVDVFCHDGPVGRLAATLSQDRLYDDPGALVTFLDNHDRPRILTACGGDAGRVADALTFMTAVRGTPCLTYGTEAGLEGAEEPFNRGDMVFGAGHELADVLAGLGRARRRAPAPARRETVILELRSDLLALAVVSPARLDLVIVNRAAEAASFAVPPIPGADGEGLVLDGLPADRRIAVPARAVVVRTWAGGGAAPFAAVAEAARRRREEPTLVPVEVEVVGVSFDAARLALVGGAAELGGWDPASPALDGQHFIPRGDLLVTTVLLPEGQAVAVKLIRREPDGSVTWQRGEDRTIFVPVRGREGPGARTRVSW